MKKIFFSLLIFSSSIIYSQNWETSYENSIKSAKIQNKKIILVFQGSDWCGPCIKLSKEIWSSQ